jgi:LysR family hydrogen peroxide-inducible transcriptional activator
MKPLPTLRQLRYLVAVAERKHFGHAAEDCLVTQSTLSAGIRELETVLGVEVFARSKRHVELTPIGERLVEPARTILAAAEDFVDLAAIGAKPLTGLIRLGVIPTVAPYLLPRALPPLRTLYPDLRVYLREEQTGVLIDGLWRGRLDAALIALPYETGPLQAALLGNDRLLLACRADHPLASRPTVDRDDLRGQPLLLLEDGHCLREHVLTACRVAPGHAKEDLQATSLGTLMQMVANGLGMTLLPEMAVPYERLRASGIVAIAFGSPQPTRQIALVWRRRSARDTDFRLLADALKSTLASADAGAAAADETSDGHAAGSGIDDDRD